MGGIGSTRWGSGRKKGTTDYHLSIDVRALKRTGKLAPGEHHLSWDDGSAMALMTSADLTGVLFYFAQDGQPHAHTVLIDYTKCNYGGERPWFVCDRCERRYAVLYVSRGAIACRGCHDLLYTSQVKSEADRAIRKAQKLGIRLGYGPNLINGQLLNGHKRPRGMSDRVYSKLKGDYESARNRAILMA